MYLKSKNGITLIALIVTIIVLIIIAGVSIATLIGDNGVLRETNTAKVTQIEATAREQVKLGCATLRLAIAEASAKDNSYDATEHIGLIQGKLYDILVKDTTGLKPEGWTKGEIDQETEKFKIVYEGQDYKDAKNDQLAKITYTIGLTQKSIELLEEKNDNTFTVSLAANIEGAGTVEFTGEHSGTSVELKEETTLTFKATANSGYEFVGWYVGKNLISSDPNATYTVNGAQTITAKFDKPTGLFDANGNLVASWDTLVNTYGMDIETDYTSSNYRTETSSPYYVLTNNSTLRNKGVKLIIPSNVTKIGNYAFYKYTKLKNVEINDGVTKIGGWAFQNCTSLTGIQIPNSVTIVGIGAFDGCTSLTGTTYDNAVYLGNDNNPYLVLYKAIDTTITSCEINENTKIICYSAFENCTSLISINIPDGVTNISGSAFENCTSLTSINIPDSVTSIGGSAFYNCTGLTSIEIPDSVTSIYTYVFYNCKSLTSIGPVDSEASVKIPENLTSIGNNAFYGCTNLTSANIPDGVTSIGQSAFRDCKNLTSIEIPDSVNSIGTHVFSGCTSLTSVEIPDNIVTIPASMFYNCESLTNVDIPDSVTSIGGYAFDECSNLTSITIPDGVTSIGAWAFGYCSKIESVYYNGTLDQWCKIDFGHSTANPFFYSKANLYINGELVTSITIPDTITKLNDDVFIGCGSLITVVIPNSVTNIGANAFDSCPNLTNIEIGSGVTNIGRHALYSCKKLANINVNSLNTEYYSIDGNLYNKDKKLLQYAIGKTNSSFVIPDGVTGIGDDAFYNCTNLTNVMIPDSVTSIGKQAFYYCENLKSISIPNGVTSIGEEAFRYCKRLNTIEISNSVTSIGKQAFYYCKNLKTVTLEATTPPTFGSNMFYDCSYLTTIYVPAESVEAYKTASGWSTYAAKIQAIPTTE